MQDEKQKKEKHHKTVVVSGADDTDRIYLQLSSPVGLVIRFFSVQAGKECMGLQFRGMG